MNDKPVAADDVYRNDRGKTIRVPAAGVLENDTDVDGDALTAVLATRPHHGQLTFRANGSFTYRSDSTFHGSDTFTYRASDRRRTSTVATVTITGLTRHPEFDALPNSTRRQPVSGCLSRRRACLATISTRAEESLTPLLVSGTLRGSSH